MVPAERSALLTYTLYLFTNADLASVGRLANFYQNTTRQEIIWIGESDDSGKHR